MLLGFASEANVLNNGGVTINQPEPNQYVFAPTPVAPGRNHYSQYTALVTWDLGFATLTYQPAFRTWDEFYPQPPNNPTSPNATVISQTSVVNKDHFLTHEVRLASDPGSRLSWQVGALYYKNNLADSVQVNILRSPLAGC